VMLEGEDEAETADTVREREELPVRLDEKYAELDGISTPVDQRETPEVEIADEAWGEQTSGPSDRAWSGDDDRSSDFSDQHSQTLQEQLIEQLELAKLSAIDIAIARVICDAITDDGYLNDSLEDVRLSLLPEIEAGIGEVERVLKIVQSLEPAGVGAIWANASHCSFASSIRAHRRAMWLFGSLSSIWIWWPASSWCCFAGSCAAVKAIWKWRSRWCVPATRAPGQRSIRPRRNT